MRKIMFSLMTKVIFGLFLFSLGLLDTLWGQSYSLSNCIGLEKRFQQIELANKTNQLLPTPDDAYEILLEIIFPKLIDPILFRRSIVDVNINGQWYLMNKINEQYYQDGRRATLWKYKFQHSPYVQEFILLVKFRIRNLYYLGYCKKIFEKNYPSQGTIEYKITRTLKSVTIEGPNSICKGETAHLEALVFDEQNCGLSNVPLIWSSSDSTVLSVDNIGNVTGVCLEPPKKASIFASSETNSIVGKIDIAVKSIAWNKLLIIGPNQVTQQDSIILEVLFYSSDGCLTPPEYLPNPCDIVWSGDDDHFCSVHDAVPTDGCPVRYGFKIEVHADKAAGGPMYFRAKHKLLGIESDAHEVIVIAKY